jgi:hypothetical protein
MSSTKGIAQSDRTPKLRHSHELIAALDVACHTSSALERSKSHVKDAH